jgi:hypothetical protein
VHPLLLRDVDPDLDMGYHDLLLTER